MGIVIHAEDLLRERRAKADKKRAEKVSKIILSTKVMDDGGPYGGRTLKVVLEGASVPHAGFYRYDPALSDRINHIQAAKRFAEALEGPRARVRHERTTGGDVTASGLRYHYFTMRIDNA